MRQAQYYLKFMLAIAGQDDQRSSETGAAIPPEMMHYGVSKAAQLAFSRGILSGGRLRCPSSLLKRYATSKEVAT
ncbi:hypothetical protein [Mesorhizobium sp.]|uniref:hypothetical protein n=1 Tax=Mesorhizobium sp. TaxID=1871066 RepID=UPI0025C5CE32|nr:hypothetical protein [Mesorhizobium sp.]